MQYHSNESHKNVILEYCKTFFDNVGRTDVSSLSFKETEFFLKSETTCLYRGKAGLKYEIYRSRKTRFR